MPNDKERASDTLIQNLKLSSTDLNAIRQLSALHTAVSSRFEQAIGLALGFNSLMKKSLNVCIQKTKKRIIRELMMKVSVYFHKCYQTYHITQPSSQ